MAIDFPAAAPPAPASLGQLEIRLRFRAAGFPTPDRAEARTIRYQLILLDANGNPVPTGLDSGDLAPYLTAQQISQAQAFLEAMRVKAQALIP